MPRETEQEPEYPETPAPWPDPPAPVEPGRRRSGRWWVLVAVALAAVWLGVAGTLIVGGIRNAASPATPDPTAPASPGSPDQVVPPAGTGAAAGRTLVMDGPVRAVSATSITLAGPSGSTRAAITDATRFTGRVHGAGGVKVGDRVLAQLAGRGSGLVATAIQDPA